MIRNEKAVALLNLLCTPWPKCFVFYEARRHPLKIGIDEDILAALGDRVTHTELSKALRIYVSNPVYRSRLKKGTARIDLNGEPVGTVTEAEAWPAMCKMVPKSKNCPKPSRKQPNQKPASPAVKRSSLADLRAAGRKQREQKQVS